MLRIRSQTAQLRYSGAIWSRVQRWSVIRYQTRVLKFSYHRSPDCYATKKPRILQKYNNRKNKQRRIYRRSEHCFQIEPSLSINLVYNSRNDTKPLILVAGTKGYTIQSFDTFRKQMKTSKGINISPTINDVDQTLIVDDKENLRLTNRSNCTVEQMHTAMSLQI